MTETYVRTQVEIQNRQTDTVPEDLTVHSVWHHHTDEGGTFGPFDPAGHAQNIANCFMHGTQGTNAFHIYLARAVTTKVYNMMDTKPRVPRAIFNYTPTGWDSTALNPRELAVGLRYYATRNQKSLRGNIRIGPLNATLINETVTSTIANQLLDLAVALANVGGANQSWCLHSEKEDDLNNSVTGGTNTAAWHDITHAWVNDLWGHQTTRERAEQQRWNVTITPGLP